MDLRVTLEERIFVANGMDLQECNLMEVHLVFLVGNLYADHLDIAVNLQVTLEERILTRMEWISRNAMGLGPRVSLNINIRKAAAWSELISHDYRHENVRCFGKELSIM